MSRLNWIPKCGKLARICYNKQLWYRATILRGATRKRGALNKIIDIVKTCTVGVMEGDFKGPMPIFSN